MKPIYLRLLISVLAFTSSAQAESSRPNIILILADDLGYGDVGCYGQKAIRTPNLDLLAREGMRFTDFHAGSTVCAPSRCVLMTGMHVGHARIRGNAKLPLRDEDVTLAELLHEKGYATALCGKWGLGDAGSSGVPNKQGFDFFYGYLNQTHAHNYYPTFLWRNGDKVKLANEVPNEGDQGQGKATVRKEYSHDLIMNEALGWIRQQKDQPFFLYLAPTLPHANNEAGKEGMEVPELGEYADRDWPAPQKAHAAMIGRLDRDVGRVIALLKELAIEDNTLILFSSDNGPHAEGGNDPAFNDSNGPLQGIKRDLTEGGIRVPFIARWPGKIAAGKTSRLLGGFQDVLPTLAEVAGADVPPKLDGLSILPTLLGQSADQKQHDYLYWVFYERGGGQAVRQGDWKLIRQPNSTPSRLYNLSDDLGETTDLAAKRPEVVAQLEKLMHEAYVPSADWTFPPTK